MDKYLPYRIVRYVEKMVNKLRDEYILSKYDRQTLPTKIPLIIQLFVFTNIYVKVRMSSIFFPSKYKYNDDESRKKKEFSFFNFIECLKRQIFLPIKAKIGKQS